VEHSQAVFPHLWIAHWNWKVASALGSSFGLQVLPYLEQAHQFKNERTLREHLSTPYPGIHEGSVPWPSIAQDSPSRKKNRARIG